MLFLVKWGKARKRGFLCPAKPHFLPIQLHEWGTRNKKFYLCPQPQNEKKYGCITDFQKKKIAYEMSLLHDLEETEYWRHFDYKVYEAEMENFRRFGNAVKVTKKDAWKISK